MTQNDDNELLHRYVDGDLRADERAALEARAKTDPTIRARIEGLLEVRQLVSDVTTDAGRDLDSAALFARIESKIAGSVGTSSSEISVDEVDGKKRPDLRVISGGGDKKPTEVPAEVRRRRMIGVVIGGLAVAAAAAIALTQFGGEPEVATEHGDEHPTVPGTVPGEDESEPEVADAEPARTEVLEVDFGTNAGTIFAVEGDAGDRYVVVWLEEETEPTN
jgi:anti-sigma factor RsiW